MDMNSLLYNVDSYKASMHNQYPEGTEIIYSYISSRGGKHSEIVISGIQYFRDKYLSTPITEQEVREASKYWKEHGIDFPEDKLLRMVEVTGGWWPVDIDAVPEGTVVPVNNVVAVVYNTDPEFYWTTTWIETALLRAIWYPSTVATNSREIKKLILNYLEKNGTPEDIYFKLHDFGSRGASSVETAAIGGMAHLINFKGTDTMHANVLISQYYNLNKSDHLKYTPSGFSIPASEHSTITSWGQENEMEAYRNIFEKNKGGIFACVSDSYNIYDACYMWNTLAEEVKESNTTLVVRPDSGDPLEVIEKCFKILDAGFGHTINSKGYAVLNNVRLIWGDGITEGTIADILWWMDCNDWSADNIAFGMGGGLLQAVTRDDQKWAMKASYAVVNGEGRSFSKNPITDKGKKSFEGAVTLVEKDGVFCTKQLKDVDCGCEKLALVNIYSNGVIGDCTTFEQIRERAKVNGY